MALVTLTYFKSFLGMPSTNTSQDTYLQVYVDQASRAFLSEIGRDIVQTNYPAAATDGQGDSGYYSGNGTSKLRLRQYPVIAAGLTVYVDNSGRFGANPDGAFDSSSTLLTYGTDYVLQLDGCLPGTSTKCSYSGILERVGTIWPQRAQYTPGQISLQPIDGLGNIKVAYTAGFPTVPNDIQMAVVTIAAYIRRCADKGGPISSESLGGYSYSLASGAMASTMPELGSVRQVVNKWREISV